MILGSEKDKSNLSVDKTEGEFVQYEIRSDAFQHDEHLFEAPASSDHKDTEQPDSVMNGIEKKK